jgi:hypothetical protein
MVHLGYEDGDDLVLVEAWRTEDLFESYYRDLLQPALGAARLRATVAEIIAALSNRTAVVAAASPRWRIGHSPRSRSGSGHRSRVVSGAVSGPTCARVGAVCTGGWHSSGSSSSCTAW